MIGRKKTASTGASPAGSTPASAISTSTTTLKKRPGKGETSVKPEAAPTPTHTPRPGAKNRPTPKRKDQEAARRRPLVETDRKAAKEADKQRTREARTQQRAAADRGEDSALPVRDRGPEKRFIRNRVDARLSLGEIAMPLMGVLLLAWFLPLPHRALISTITLALVWVIILAGIVDAVIMWRGIKKALTAKFGDAPKGSAQYAVTRAMQMRLARYPRPLVKRGASVD